MPDLLLVPRDPEQPVRQRRFDEIVALILNGLVQAGDITMGAGGTWTVTAGVTSFNGRTGAVALTSLDVTTALGFSDFARKSQANVFTVGPQTINSDNVAHSALILTAFSTSQTANVMEVRDAPSGNVRWRTRLHSTLTIQATLGDIANFDAAGAAAMLGFGVPAGVPGTTTNILQFYQQGTGTLLVVNAVGTIKILDTTFFYGINNDPGRYSVGTDTSVSGYFGIRIHGYNIVQHYADASPHSLLTLLPSSTTAGQIATEEISSWSTSTHATRKARWSVGVHDAATSAGAPREGLRVDTDGAAAFTTVPCPAFVSLSDAVTAATTDALTLRHLTSGTAAAGFGTTLRWQLESTTTDNRDAARIDVTWATATDAARAGRVSFVVYDTTDPRETLRLDTAGGGAYTAVTAFGVLYARRSVSGVTISAPTVLALQHDSSGTPAAGFGATLSWQLESDTTEDQDAAAITASWVDATHASRKARLTLSAYDTVVREGFRVEGTGSRGAISFFGTAAAIQQTSGADLTNNVTSGGTNNVIADFTDLAIYANDAAAIRNDIYQLARKLKQVNDALRLYGLLT